MKLYVDGSLWQICFNQTPFDHKDEAVFLGGTENFWVGKLKQIRVDHGVLSEEQIFHGLAHPPRTCFELKQSCPNCPSYSYPISITDPVAHSVLL